MKYHAIFHLQSDGRYLIIKDVYDHFSKGAIISGTMINFYRNCYPAAIIEIIEDVD